MKAFYYAGRLRIEAETLDELESLAQLSGRNTLTPGPLPRCHRIYTTRNPDGNTLGDQYHTGGPARVVFAAEWDAVSPAGDVAAPAHLQPGAPFAHAEVAEEGGLRFAQNAASQTQTAGAAA